MSNSELIEYLKKSSQGRRQLLEKAEEYVNPTSNSNNLAIPSSLPSEFPMPSPLRFAKFQENVSVNLKKIFKPEKALEKKKLPVLRSLSKEENYKKVYLGVKKNSVTLRNGSSGNYSISSGETKKYVSLLPKSHIKEKYLVPLFSKYYF